MSERRAYERHSANVVVGISTDERKDRVGVTSDVSATGLRLHSLSRFAVGERVSLVFRTQDVDSLATGRVVRASRDTSWHMFPNVHAVELETPAPELVPRLIAES
jgi:hypothetical protein